MQPPLEWRCDWSWSSLGLPPQKKYIYVCVFYAFWWFFRSILPIHPSFRVLALAEPPVVGAATSNGSSSSNSRGQQWLNPELLTMFLYHTVSPLAMAEEMGLIQSLVRPKPPNSTSSPTGLPALHSLDICVRVMVTGSWYDTSHVRNIILHLSSLKPTKCQSLFFLIWL